MAGTLYRMDYSAQTAGGGAIYIGQDGVTGMDLTGSRYSGGLVVSDRLRGAIILTVAAQGNLVTGREVSPGETVRFEVDAPPEILAGAPFIVLLDGQQVSVQFTKISDIPIPPSLEFSNPMNSQFLPTI